MATLSAGTLNRTVLHRQLLLARHRLSLPRTLERVAGLQNQYAPSSYIGLWSRLEGFRRPMLTRALERRTVVQGTLMRGTIHLVSREDYSPFADGLADIRRQWWLGVVRSRGVEVDHEAMAKAAADLLADGPLRRRELVEGLEGSGFPRQAFEGLGLWLDLVRVPPSGTWERRRADLYQTAESWIGHSPGDRGAGLDHLVRRYLGAFGPAHLEDISSWLGAPRGTVAEQVDRMQLRRFHSEDGTVLVDLPRLRIVEGDAPSPARFLGPWEAILLTHARRAGVLPEEFRPLVFSTKNPHSVGTFLVDGRVAGGWRSDGGKVQLEPFGPIPGRFRREVEEEAGALSAFLT